MQRFLDNVVAFAPTFAQNDKRGNVSSTKGEGRMHANPVAFRAFIPSSHMRSSGVSATTATSSAGIPHFVRDKTIKPPC